jgi:hypothetical protein
MRTEGAGRRPMRGAPDSGTAISETPSPLEIRTSGLFGRLSILATSPASPQSTSDVI